MFNNIPANLASLEYRDITFLQAIAPPDDLPPLLPGVPEHEVEQRVAAARAAATAEAEQRISVHLSEQHAKTQQQMAAALDAFSRERTAYFDHVEEGIVHLALSIARKILQRESELDPTLLAGLVRIALDRMQSGTAVQVRVAPADAELWRSLARNTNGVERWQVEEDPLLQPGDCLVRTEMGEANFGLEAQICDVEQSFRGLLAHKPGAR